MDARGRTGGRRGIRTHGGPEDLNSFRDCPIRPLWQPSTIEVSGKFLERNQRANIPLAFRCRNEPSVQADRFSER